MDVNRTINFLLIIGGGLTALLAQSDSANSQYIIIAGIVALMIGVYRVSRNIRSKSEDDEDRREFIIDENFNEKTDLKDNQNGDQLDKENKS